MTRLSVENDDTITRITRKHLHKELASFVSAKGGSAPAEKSKPCMFNGLNQADSHWKFSSQSPPPSSTPFCKPSATLRHSQYLKMYFKTFLVGKIGVTHTFGSKRKREKPGHGPKPPGWKIKDG
jgi:hypothetical protein